ncbi:zf-HC2 domain-containing protein [bacterium]|nr:zf-HC2 domain-containing protein [bacterium]
MKCEAVRKKLSAYIDQEISPELARQMNAHIQSCPSCQKEAEDLKQLWQTMGEWDAPDILSEDFETRVLRNTAKQTIPGTWLDKISQNIIPKTLLPVPAALLLMLGIYLGHYMGSLLYEKEFVPSENDSITSITGVDNFLNEYDKIYSNLF